MGLFRRRVSGESPGRSRKWALGRCVLRTGVLGLSPKWGPSGVWVLLLWWRWGLCVCPPGRDLVVSYRQECVEQLLRNMFDGVQTELCLVQWDMSFTYLAGAQGGAG